MPHIGSHYQRDNDGTYLKECFELRRQGWSYSQLAKKFGKNHSTILYHCLRNGVYKNGYRGNKIDKYILPVLEKTCPACHTKFETKVQIKKYCSPLCKTKQYQNANKSRPQKIGEVAYGLDERNEKVNLGLSYKDYLLRANGGNTKKVNKILRNANKCATIYLPKRTKTEYKKERDLATEKRLHGLKT